MIAFITAHEREAASRSTAEIGMVAHAATLAGCTIYYIPPDLERCETAANALWHVPSASAPCLAVWMGFIPALDYYAAIYDAALAKGLRLLNSHQEHRRAMEFAHFYPRG